MNVAVPVAVAAVEAIDLLTYNGEDPCLIHEPACQKCHAKQSETQLTRCAGCSVILYCSEDCVEADSKVHRVICRALVENKAEMEASVQELREQHQITDPFVPKRSIPAVAYQAHKHLEDAVTYMASGTFVLSVSGETKELWEMMLDSYQKLFRMSEKGEGHLLAAPDTAFTLIRLNRLEDAWRFIRNVMVTYNCRGWRPIVIEYETDDRNTDCLEWVRSSYPSEANKDAQEHYHWLILGLITIKLRIRVIVARNAWNDMINKVFLKTKRGQELDEVKSILEEYFSLSDDTVQLEQIRQLMAFLHSFDSSLLPKLVNIGTTPMIPALANACICLLRTPKAHEFLSTELASQGFMDRVEQLKVARDAAPLANFKAKWFGMMLFLDLVRRYNSFPPVARCLGFLTLSLFSVFTTVDFLDKVTKILARSWSDASARLARNVVRHMVFGVFGLGMTMTIIRCAGELEGPVAECPGEAFGTVWNMALLLGVANTFLAYHG